ncbi:Uncharacterised protein [Comamonas aquatica]|uniref:ORC-CDC6 family AAA ATPase n=1 Tax=Comamonas aquatica TaxID=225991 RepID=UPI001EF2CBE7|nr:hypothetical protein [Comamonas aquatica]CAB5678084.1 Uncharacterised protein [Comamonas aquatica]CAC9213271.1 Uncharacterised protein [Comamonas aquatica]
MSENKSQDNAATLRQLFGDNRAEWPATSFRDVFVTPTYLTKLEARRPCILVGGRGTGKTTALQSLKYDSYLERLKSEGQSFSDQEYLGFLIRINKNRVRSFHGRDETLDWGKYFSHYFNLLACAEINNLALWLQEQTNLSIPSSAISSIATDLGIINFLGSSLQELSAAIKDQISKLQLKVNNPSSQIDIYLSMAESPIRTFVDALEENGLTDGRTLFCCIDEYENLLDYQQAIINTYVKHATPPLSYKIGVRKNGLRNRRTLDGQDLLKTPDDYLEIEISEEGFDYFAKNVASARLKVARALGVPVPEKLSDFLQDLSLSEEATLLGAERIAKAALQELENTAAHQYFSKKPAHLTYFLKYWQASENTPLLKLAEDWMTNEKEWDIRIGNYGYASLFWLSRGNKGARIRKYYCGERIFLALASGNIRYFLELIDCSVTYELSDGKPFPTELRISPKSQTLAAREVGERRLNQLEGLADHGVQLKRLVLAIGKVFFELAREPLGKTPEVTSFILSGKVEQISKISELLSEGVGHLAFEVEPATKLTSKAEIRDDEYRLHRIFSAFFEISHRKKRRMTFNSQDLVSVLGDHPGKAISSMLEDKPQIQDEELPEQLALFSAFYGDTDPGAPQK